MSKLLTAAFPVKWVEAPTSSAFRAFIVDANDRRVAVLYESDPKMADAIVKGLNRSGPELQMQAQNAAHREEQLAEAAALAHITSTIGALQVGLDQLSVGLNAILAKRT